MKAFPRCGEGRPGGGEAQEGRGSDGALTGSAVTALSAGSKALKSSDGVAGAGQTAGDSIQRQEGMTRPAKAGTAPRGGTNP